MAGLELVSEDNRRTQGLVLVLFFCRAVGVDAGTLIWRAPGGMEGEMEGGMG